MVELVGYIHSEKIKMKAGIAINPETSVEVLYDVLNSHEPQSRPDVGTCPGSFVTSLTCYRDGLDSHI